ncbi:hypothetical protein [Pradoshia sp.]
MEKESTNDLNDVNKRGISAFHRLIDMITAILLLTEQITIIGVFLRPGRFAFSVGGPIFGGSRVVAKDDLPIEQEILDVINIILAILLISDKITITGLFITSGEFTINVSGPIFGYPKVVPSTLMLENYKLFHAIVKEHYTVPPELLSNFDKGMI